MNIKKRHHYVWQKYLTSWAAEEDKVCCLRNGSIKRIHPKNLAVERRFYKIDLIDTSEYEFIKMLAIPEGQSPFLKEINKGWLEFFDNVFLLLKAAKSANDLYSEKSIALQAMEDFHCEIESRGVYLNDLLEGNVDFWEAEDERIDFVLYLFFQYFRTKRMQTACLNCVNEFIKKSGNNNLLNISPTGYAILSVLFSSNMAYDFSKRSTSIKLIKNKSNLNFIIGDQPVVNIIQDKNIGESFPKDVELYYPISPKLGVFIGCNEKFSLDYGDSVGADEVRYLNGLIADNFEEQLFGNREEDLLPFIKNVTMPIKTLT